MVRKEDFMRGDILFGMAIGAIVGMTIATFCEDAQTVVKNSANTLADGTKKLVRKSNGD